MRKARKSVRFKPDPMTIAMLDFKSGKIFKPEFVGLILNESYSGCGILMYTDHTVKKDMKLKIQVGKLPVLKAKIAWIKVLEENILKMGIKFLE